MTMVITIKACSIGVLMGIENGWVRNGQWLPVWPSWLARGKKEEEGKVEEKRGPSTFDVHAPELVPKGLLTANSSEAWRIGKHPLHTRVSRIDITLN